MDFGDSGPFHDDIHSKLVALDIDAEPYSHDSPDLLYSHGRPALPRPASSANLSSSSASDPNDFSFTFSEEDLIPSKPMPQNASFHAYPQELYLDAHHEEIKPSVLYSKQHDAPTESKITVSRALLVSSQSKSKNKTVDESGQKAEPTSNAPRPAPVLPRSKSFSKSFPGFGRKSKAEVPKVPKIPVVPDSNVPANENEATQDKNGIAVDVKESNGPIRIALSRRKSSKSTKEKPKVNEPLQQEQKDLAKLAAKAAASDTKSIKKKRMSLGSFLRNSPTPPATPSPPTSTSSERRSSDNNDPLHDSVPAKILRSSPQQADSPSLRPSTPLQKSFSVQNIPSMITSGADAPPIPPLPGTVVPERYRRPTSPVSHRKDDLWIIFRALDADFQKFQTKSITMKAEVVITCLQPFLRDYADHPSNKRLRPQDLDRRTTILNKWWSGMLEVINGRHNQILPGTDRPILLAAITGIMERQEWRAAPSPFCALAERIVIEPNFGDEDANFLADSVRHNVRNMFVQNLFAQIVFVVDKMSARLTPASLVAFCGKSCAYAFYFCPGIADILVRLWSLEPQHIRRIVDGYTVEKPPAFRQVSENVLSGFPQNMHSLAFTSTRDMLRTLKENPVLPLGVEKIQWRGPWLSRWTGHETDLFYVFVRSYHTLLAEFLLQNVSKTERACAPGLVLVHAQILANLDATIRRQCASAIINPLSEPLIEFDDLDSDNIAATLGATGNAARTIAENRLLVLLRDVLHDKTVHNAPSNRIIAEAFCDILKASARATSLFDHDACFTLCDFLQEALSLLAQHHRDVTFIDAVIDWTFWIDVFKKMVESENTMTEIRLYALIFSIWPELSSSGNWKVDLCLNFLLAEKFFIARFNHWCPMVRAYYMRLLCWRLARFDGESSDNDTLILEVLMQRLQLVWRYFKHIDLARDFGSTKLLSTAPSNPAPGRRLLIIRTDQAVATSALSFKDILASTNSIATADKPEDGLAKAENAGRGTTPLLDRLTAGVDIGGEPKKKGNYLLRSLLGNRSPDNRSRSQSPRNLSPTRSGKSSSHTSRNGSPERTRSSLYESRPSPIRATSLPQLTRDRRVKQLKEPQPTQAFFKFSLEFMDRRPYQVTAEIELHPPRVPLAAQLLLQSRPGFQDDLDGKKPPPFATGVTTYAGRALAEWSLVVNECQNFFERRRNEGVASNSLVETPILGVESFRKPG